MRKSWWKILCVILLLYTFIGGFLMDVPRLPALSETIRNLYFHVCMWFCMMILFSVSVVYAIRYLRTNKLTDDIYSRHFAAVGIVFGVLGYATGSIWMSYTWADPNNSSFQSFGAVAREPKLIGAGRSNSCYGVLLDAADGDVTRGLWLPVGWYGVLKIPVKGAQ